MSRFEFAFINGAFLTENESNINIPDFDVILTEHRQVPNGRSVSYFVKFSTHIDLSADKL